MSHHNPFAQKRKILAASLLGLAVFLMWQAFWLKKFIAAESRPPAWDQSIHLEIALDYRHAVGEGRWSELLHLSPKPGMPAFPPLYHLGLFWIYGQGDPALAALWMNWAYLSILCMVLFAIGYDYIGAEKALGAAILFACAPVVQWLMHNQLIDLQLTAIVAAAYWALLKSAAFEKWEPSIGFGFLYGLGMLCKWSFFSYLAPAYWMAGQAFRRSETRPKVLAAVAVACAVCGPWYAAHLSDLPLRLVQASADAAVAVWRGAAFFDYFLNIPNDFGVVFWILGSFGILLRHYRERQKQDWVLPAWVIGSYVFWAVVPNRQMRFLLPGLPGLAILACSAIPRSVLWVAVAFQLFVAANYSAAWVSPKVMQPLDRPIVFFPTDPPQSENWRIADILKAAQQKHTSNQPISNLTLVANAPYFNCPTFTWILKYLDLPNIKIRGVNRRLCEFSEFVVLKTGSLGPPGVISGLPEAAEILLQPGGWFERSYESAGSWPLPDGFLAILFQQRRLKQPPFPVRPAFFQYYAEGSLNASHLRVEFGSWDATESVYRNIRVSTDEAELRQFKMRNLKLELDEALIVPAGPMNKLWVGGIRFLKMKRLKIVSLIVTKQAFQEFLEKRAPGLRVQRVDMGEGVLTVAARFKWIPLFAQATASLISETPRRLEVRLLKARIGPFPVPLGLFQRLRTFAVNLEPNPETPFAIDIPQLRIEDGKLSVP